MLHAMLLHCCHGNVLFLFSDFSVRRPTSLLKRQGHDMVETGRTIIIMFKPIAAMKNSYFETIIRWNGWNGHLAGISDVLSWAITCASCAYGFTRSVQALNSIVEAQQEM